MDRLQAKLFSLSLSSCSLLHDRPTKSTSFISSQEQGTNWLRLWIPPEAVCKDNEGKLCPTHCLCQACACALIQREINQLCVLSYSSLICLALAKTSLCFFVLQDDADDVPACDVFTEYGAQSDLFWLLSLIVKYVIMFSTIQTSKVLWPNYNVDNLVSVETAVFFQVHSNFFVCLGYLLKPFQ